MTQGISTFLAYKQTTHDMNKSLLRVASEAQNKHDAAYYKDNIGKVKSLDDFLKNSRLYNYAMNAFGLSDMAYARAFMRKVFESNVSDPKSFVRRLTDPRFLKIAQAFNFSADGSIKQSPVTGQEADDVSETVGLYSDRRMKQANSAATEVNYYQRSIGLVTSVDDLLSKPRLVNFILQSVGLGSEQVSGGTLKSILTSDVSDPTSFASQSGNATYIALASAFSFGTDGNVTSSGAAQSTSDVANTIYGYYDTTGNGASAQAGAFKSTYYRENISGVGNVDQLLANDKLIDFALAAHGLDPAVQSKARLRQILTSDLADPNSEANQQTSLAYRSLVAEFNFNSDGSVQTGNAAQAATQTDATVNGFLANFQAGVAAADGVETAYYKSGMSRVGRVGDLIRNARLYDYVLRAYGIDPSTTSKLTITKVLESDVFDPLSFANASGNSAYKALAAAFNFGADGTAQPASTAQFNSDVVSTVTAYNQSVGDTTARKQSTQQEDAYYANTINRVQSVDELIADRRLVAYIQKAYGLAGETISPDTIKKILTSDPLDPKSYVNQAGNARFRPLATAFNFDPTGKISPAPKFQAQSKSERVATADRFVQQSLEQEAGSSNEAVRLALYFRRVAPNLSSAYGILADKALLQVAKTALGLPATFSNASIDTQFNILKKKINVADFKDPQKLDKFIARFASLNDVKGSGLTSGSAALQLLNRVR